ncbi:MAG: Mur ligase family protein [Microgenomates group bacterium]
MIRTWPAAQIFLNSFIPVGIKYTYTGDHGLLRTKYLLALCGNPQEKVKVIHIAGTSGKGSTATMISTALIGQGFKVGLSLSPHVIDLRERFQINNAFVTFNDVMEIVNELQEAVKQTTLSKHGKPTYFEIITALTFLLFCKKQVDYAVMETGLGGTYDATNVVSNESKVAVITKIGHDHMGVLGKTLPKIASQKAGIILEKNSVISTSQRESVRRVLDERAKQMHTSVQYVKPSIVKWNIQLPILGKFQIENCAVALSTIELVSKRDNWSIDATKLRETMNHLEIPGRMQKIVINGKTVILDGAHNPQKMSALIKSLKELYPNQKLDFLVALKKGKDYRNTLKYILPKANTIVCTKFLLNTQGFPMQAEEPEKLISVIEKAGYIPATVVENPHEALKHSLKHNKNILIITGSFYLVSELYSELI